MVLKTDSVDISARLKAFHQFGVDSLAVTPKPISWLVEPQESTVGKRLSP